MSVIYVCECCGEPITREDMIHTGLTLIAKHVKKMSPQKRRQRAQKAWEAKQALKAQGKNNVK